MTLGDRDVAFYSDAPVRWPLTYLRGRDRLFDGGGGQEWDVALAKANS